MKHTKGPWTIERTYNTFEIARITPKPGFEDIKNIRETVFLQTDAGCLIPNPANAKLIAAAPEMLHALEMALPHIKGNAQGMIAMELVVNAIKKAQGE